MPQQTTETRSEGSESAWASYWRTLHGIGYKPCPRGEDGLGSPRTLLSVEQRKRERMNRAGKNLRPAERPSHASTDAVLPDLIRKATAQGRPAGRTTAVRRSNWLPRRSYCEPHDAICVVGALNALMLLPSIERRERPARVRAARVRAERGASLLITS